MFEKASNKPFVIMRNKYGWKLYEYHNIKVWFFGYQYDCSINSLLGNISLLLQNSCIDKRGVLRWIKGLSGHFSIVVESDSWVVAVVDKICTNPIFFVRHEDDIFISNHADALKEECNINKNDLDSFAGLEIFMSGFTIGSKTLYRGIKRLSKRFE